MKKKLNIFLITTFFVYIFLSLIIAISIGYQIDSIPNNTSIQKFNTYLIGVFLNNFSFKFIFSSILSIAIIQIFSCKKNNFIVIIFFILIIFSPPVLAPLLHNNASEESAIRNYIQNKGNPYQSFFAVINKNDTYNGTTEYSVLWIDENGNRNHICSTSIISNGRYAVSCRTIVYLENT